MSRFLAFLLTGACLGGISVALSAQPGRLGTLPLGTYICSLPGDADGQAWVVLPGEGFTIENGSAYRTDNGSGTYLLAGDIVTFTRGPLKNMRYTRSGNASLQRIEADGKPGRVRCVRTASRS